MAIRICLFLVQMLGKRQVLFWDECLEIWVKYAIFRQFGLYIGVNIAETRDIYNISNNLCYFGWEVCGEWKCLGFKGIRGFSDAEVFVFDNAVECDK